MEQIEDKIEADRILNNAAYRRFIPQLIKDHEREWIVISKGELIRIFASRQEAIRAIKTHNLLQQCNLVSPITQRKRKVTLGFGRKLQ